MRKWTRMWLHILSMNLHQFSSWWFLLASMYNVSIHLILTLLSGAHKIECYNLDFQNDSIRKESPRTVCGSLWPWKPLLFLVRREEWRCKGGQSGVTTFWTESHPSIISMWQLTQGLFDSAKRIWAPAMQVLHSVSDWTDPEMVSVSSVCRLRARTQK